MLKINPDPKFKKDVEITVPGQDEPGTIPLTFKYMGRKEYAEWCENTREVKDEDGKVIQKGKTVAESFPEFVLGWGLKEKFSQENIDTFLNNYPAAYGEIFAAYSSALLGSRIKN